MALRVERSPFQFRDDCSSWIDPIEVNYSWLSLTSSNLQILSEAEDCRRPRSEETQHYTLVPPNAHAPTEMGLSGGPFLDMLSSRQ